MAKTKENNNMQILFEVKQIIFMLNNENIESSVEKTVNLFDQNYPYSFNLLICLLIYSAFISRNGDADIYLSYLKSLQLKEEEKKKNITKIIDIFSQLLLKNNTQDSYYFIEKMIKQNFIGSSITKTIGKKYFVHYNTRSKSKCYSNDPSVKIFNDNIDELHKDDWNLHKILINEGTNPSEIAKIIRNDEIEKLQEKATQTDFDFNQKIEPALYEKYSFINEENISLIDYAAFFGSIKCFRYLMINDADLTHTGKYAVAGGNIEIIRLCVQKHSSFKGAFETAIKFHQNDIFHFIYENELEELSLENYSLYDFIDGVLVQVDAKPYKLAKLGVFCSKYCNYDVLSFLEEEGMHVGKTIINESARMGNLYLVRHFLEKNKMPRDILLYATESGNLELINYILKRSKDNLNLRDDILYNFLKYKNTIWNFIFMFNTALLLAVDKGYTEIAKVFLQQKGIDVNIKNILLF